MAKEAESQAENSLIRKADFLFSFCGEKKRGNGEDSYYYALNVDRAMLAVFDGCGGPGAAAYPALRGKTGAYLAARAVSAAWLSWFEALRPDREGDEAELRQRTMDYLRRCEANAGEESGRPQGRMPRKLPTTAAAALCRSERSGVDVRLFWAGDSRVYLLDSEGLAQLTEDDPGGVDAMRKLSENGAPANVINLSREFGIHCARLNMGRPGLLFAATRGCFGALSTPMEFENLLLNTLLSAPNVQEWEKNLKTAVGKNAGEDYTLSGAAFGFGGLDELKRQLAGRARLLYRTYIYGLDGCSKEEKQQLWEHYKPNYERLLCRVTGE
ncbi:MAG: protein phosphatase 2C domain-containing protein [Oscillospiraceae bacterium]|nr:protein phosphatase 2C domain-containing protein [Oscillospiraceae bacterium]